MAKKLKDVQYYEAIGRRKEAVARVRVYLPGKEKAVTVNGSKINQGEILVNNKPIATLFKAEAEIKRYIAPLELTNNKDRFAITILLEGGGRNGQLEAIIHGLSRAISMVNPEEYKPTLRDNHLLTRDPRARERRKVGTGGKARRQKQYPKR